MTPRWRHLPERLYYDLVLGPRGFGRRVEADTWDRQYAAGDWAHLHSLDELGRNMVIAGYVWTLAPRARVLDIGCGNGRLAQVLEGAGVTEYLGIDLSSAAIEQARRLDVPNARFEVADLEEYRPEGAYDVVVFNESLSHARSPLATLRRFSQALERDGMLVVALSRYGFNDRIWRALAADMEIVHGTGIENPRRQEWDVRVLRPSTTQNGEPVESEGRR